MRIVLWDVDGTLLLNGGRAGRLYNDAIRDVTGYVSGDTHPGEHGKTDGQIISERLAEYELDAGLLPAVSTRLDELSEAANRGPDARVVAPGVPAALAAVAAAGWRNGVLTGNSPARARFKLGGAGLDLDAFDWAHSYFGERALVRRDITVAAAADLGDATAVILGDTPSDGEAAAAVGFPFLAVATGIFSEADLAVTAATLVIPNLVDGLDELLAALADLA